MVAPNLKAETFSLMERRSSIENQMNVIIERLIRPGGAGLYDNLLDSEGFPRSDIDIMAIRADRKRLSEFRNDHSDITRKIDLNLQILHSRKVNQDAFSQTGMNSGVVSPLQHITADSMNLEQPLRMIPFLLIDEINDASPAAIDGLQIGDQIVKFGSVEVGDQILTRLSSVIQLNQGKPIAVVIMRQGVLMNITMTPRQWHGRGLMGCHFQTL
ncbi:26S proteasome non-ATPase regulatory subunit 9 [Zostera marina]|uniref:26S proteasome non-ATPase regulatory subunit 9 n=1 Tax=Zostera marina TaxID=29655 RepID=A0A0K9P0I0_ZOSMR|nr:26S proteasome non-ATPase regulatory subunit 9 [Zostera marina]